MKAAYVCEMQTGGFSVFAGVEIAGLYALIFLMIC
jgi:hypothetical protein